MQNLIVLICTYMYISDIICPTQYTKNGRESFEDTREHYFSGYQQDYFLVHWRVKHLFTECLVSLDLHDHDHDHIFREKLLRITSKNKSVVRYVLYLYIYIYIIFLFSSDTVLSLHRNITEC